MIKPSYRDRFQEQVTVWLDENGNEGAIAPSIIPAGTVTRRAVHKLWLTAINPKVLNITITLSLALLGETYF